MKEILKASRSTFEMNRKVELIPPLALAYIGDSVYELFIRHCLLTRPNLKPHHLQKQAVSYVSATAQAAALTRLMPHLTETEQDVVRRGRNAKSGTIPKSATVSDYRHSTALEALIGHLYLSDEHDRLVEIMRYIIEEDEE
ncbi:Mini-ribonuclease 3 [Marinicrinis sediminis]|uniref:Mini-ribonuclease 3 n=1 Tax=Marinicrinis sediminis TaxID=1652465 RepID=A0ABW5RCS0_9BACL